MEYTPIKCNKSGKLHPLKHWKTAPVDRRIRHEIKNDITFRLVVNRPLSYTATNRRVHVV